VYKLGVRIPRVGLTVAAVAALTLAGCGKGTPSQAAEPTKHNAGAYDTVDVCGLATDEQLKDVLGEAVAAKTPKDDDSLRGCVVDGESHRFYLFITVRRSPAGGSEQFKYDRGSATDPQTVTGIGFDAFSYGDTDESHVEALDGDLVVRVSFVFYTDGGSVSQGPELTARLATLTKHLVQRV
jgi:hypothetical protein